MFALSGMSWTSRLMLMAMIGMALYALAGWIGGLGSWLSILAVMLLLLTAAVLLHEQALLGPVSRLPLIGRLLDWFVVRSGQTMRDGGRRRLTRRERGRRSARGHRALRALELGEAYERLVVDGLVAPFARVATDLPHCAVIAGSPGIGKRTAAGALIDLMVGETIVPEDIVCRVGKRELEDGATFGRGEAVAEDARGGVLLMETVDAWLDEPGAADFLEGLAEKARLDAPRTTVVMTASGTAANRLTHDPAFSAVAARLDLRRIDIPDLGDETLVAILTRELATQECRLAPDLERALLRLVRDSRETAGEGYRFARTVRHQLAVDLRRAARDDGLIDAGVVERVRRAL